jgi:hypothetical protein
VPVGAVRSPAVPSQFSGRLFDLCYVGLDAPGFRECLPCQEFGMNGDSWKCPRDRYVAVITPQAGTPPPQRHVYVSACPDFFASTRRESLSLSMRWAL